MTARRAEQRTQAGALATSAPLALSDPGQAGVIETAHQRSRQFGLSAIDTPDFAPLARADLQRSVEQSAMLYRHALPVMETLYEQIRNTHNMVLLTDDQGLILHALGDDDFLEKADRVALRPGVTWSERSKGTNAIGTALATGAATLVHGAQHYLRVNHFLTCSCAPIVDPHGRGIGTIDVTGDHQTYHQHTMALVRMSAQMIENHFYTDTFPDALRIHFHSRPEFIGTLVEGIAAFTLGGRFLSANRSAQFQLGLPLAALGAHTFTSLFGLPMSTLFDHYRARAPGHLQACMHNGVTIRMRADFSAPSTLFGSSADAAVVAKDPAGHAPRTTHRPGLSSLRYLDTGDARVAAVIAKVDKVIGRDIPILVLGETGTGKELLAQAIHNDSARRAAPFVAVNCASIPETLIESELFGYAEGAFTGARRRGGVGKMLLANGGTLFLDEIGDMALNLQARLLRVLQERVITPLGSDKTIPVDFTLVCATHRNLRDLIAAGAFREDLYYRLNGLVVRLPALRERSDLEVIVHKLIDNDPGRAGRVPLRVAPEVMALFRRYDWPGNFRQLGNLLRTAAIMADGDGEIRVEHLGDDFLDDVRLRDDAAPASGATAAPTVTTPVRLDDVQGATVDAALARCAGNVSAAARLLGVSRNTVYRAVGRKAGKPSA